MGIPCGSSPTLVLSRILARCAAEERRLLLRAIGLTLTVGMGTLNSSDERDTLQERMSQVVRNERCCGGRAEIVADLVEHDLLQLQPGERLWKLYCFQDAGHPTGLRHRIYTKQKADGRLELLTFAVHNPRRDDGTAEDTPPVRSSLARVPDLSAADLDRLIGAMQSQAGGDTCDEVDLSRHGELTDQLRWLNVQHGG